MVGALGSGLWSAVFAPVGSLLIKVFLSVVTLGIGEGKNSIYRHAAFGFSERSSNHLLIGVATLVLFSPAIMYVSTRRRLVSLSGTRGDPTGERTKGNAINWKKQTNVLLIGMALVSSILCVQLLMSVYSNTVVANFHRTLAVATPHISSEQRSIYLARFAKVQTRKDFIALFTELNSVLKDNGEPASDFSPW